MKDKFWQSKKFWAAVIGGIAALGTFLTTHFGMDIPVDEAINLVYAIAALFGVYMAAEGYSEKDAKAQKERSPDNVNNTVFTPSPPNSSNPYIPQWDKTQTYTNRGPQ